MRKEIVAFFISMLPIVEIRGALPVALATGVHPVWAILITVVGNLRPIPSILRFIRPIFKHPKTINKIGDRIRKNEKKALSK